MMRFKASTIALLGGLLGCRPAQVLPVIDEVSPNWGYNAEVTEIHVRGEGFFAGVGASGSEIERYDRDFLISLVGRQGEFMLGDITQVSEEELTAVVPAGLDASWYDLRVVTPGQAEVLLRDGFEVTSTRADAVEAQASATRLSVSSMSILRLKVVNPDGETVQDSFPVTLRLRPTETDGEGFSLDPGNLVDVNWSASGREVQGSTGATGDAYVILSSSEPDQMWVDVEVSLRDRDSISTTQLISFEAGSVAGLEVSLPDGLDSTTAGDAFEVGLRLVDTFGNTVLGQAATVAMAETCGGGGWTGYVTFVDTASALVTPTQACPDNSIQVFGVTGDGGVSGQSEAFVVTPGELEGLSVLATPELVQAGMDDVVFFVHGTDAWQNRTADPIGELTLYDEGEPIVEGSGSGVFSCEAVVEGTAQCIARLYKASPGRVVEVRGEAGISGEANAVQVLPGPGSSAAVTMTEDEVVAGAGFTLSVSVEDAFSNPIILSADALDGVLVSDEYGGVDCVHVSSDSVARTYGFECTVTVAGADNVLHVQVPSVGVIGHSGLFDVRPGPLARATLTVDETVIVDGVDVGAGFPLAVEGLDAFGNRVDGDWVVDLRSVAGGLDVTALTLESGVAFQWVVPSVAARGESIWVVSEDGLLLGGSQSFDVRAGEPVGLTVRAASRWAITGQPLEVDVGVVDAWGNPVDIATSPVDVELVGGLGPDVVGVTSGLSTLEVLFEEAGLGERLRVSVGDLTAESDAIDVALDCGREARTLYALGVDDGRVCLTGESLLRVRWPLDGLQHVILEVNGEVAARGDVDDLEVRVSEPSFTMVEGLLIDDEACGEAVQFPFYAGAVDAPVGPVSLAASTDVLMVGGSSSSAVVDLLVEAETCDGGPASSASLRVRSTKGRILELDDGGAVVSTGSGLQVELGDDGSASVAVSVIDEVTAGTTSVHVGTVDGSSSGAISLAVSGDIQGPAVVEVSPSGHFTGTTSFIDVEFSEPMLWVDDLLPSGTYLDLTAEDGRSIDIADVLWMAGSRKVRILLEAPLDLSSDVVTLDLFDELRDVAGNRLDGDLDGVAGGTWSRDIGALMTTAPDVTDCWVSTGWFRPDGDPGPGIEAEQVWLDMIAEDSSSWWQVDVMTGRGERIARHLRPRVRPLDGSFVFDGRGPTGEVLPPGLYVLSARALDDDGNHGDACEASVVISQLVGR